MSARSSNRVGTLRWVGLLAATLLLVSACGDDTPQPGELRIVVSDSLALGGAVLELSGEGMLDVRGPPGTRLLARPVQAGGSTSLPRLRVIAIQETPGPLTLTLEVADREAPLVGATLVQASGADDALLPGTLLPPIRVFR